MKGKQAETSKEDTMGLFKPGWMSENFKNALAALNKVQKEATLRDAALNASNHYIREEAVKRIWDCQLILDVINTPKLSVPREAAIKRLRAVEPLCRVWDGLEKMDKRAIESDAKLQSCLAAVARYAGGYGLRRKAAAHLADQATLKWLAAKDLDQGVRMIALERVNDPQYLNEAFDSADDEDIRLAAIANMTDTGRAVKLAHTAQKAHICTGAVKKAGDPALALVIMDQTLNEYILRECTKLVSPEDLEDDRQLALMALSGPEEARVQAKSRIRDFGVFERIAMHDGPERFPSEYQTSFLCSDALKYVSGDEALLRVHHGAKDSEISENALLRIGRLDTMLSLFDNNPKRYRDRKFFERLDEIDKDWVQKAGNRTVEGLAGILAENTADQRFDYTHIAAALRRMYGKGHAVQHIAALKGTAVSHSDSSGKVNRDKGCHEDGGFTYLELDDIKPDIDPVIFRRQNNRDVNDALQDLQAVTSQLALKEIALDGDVAPRIRAAAARRITDEYTLLDVALKIEMPEEQDFNLHTIKNPDMLLLVANDAKDLRIRKQALKRIHDAKALFKLVSANVQNSFKPEICERLSELDADWAQQLDDAAVKTLTCVIANNKKDEQFDYRHYAAALKSIYRQGRAKAAIEGLHGKAVAHFDYTGKEYRDKWCHQDGDYIYFDLLPKPEEHVPAVVPETNAEDRIPYYEKELREQMAALDAITSPEELKKLALDTYMPLLMREEAVRRIADEDTLMDIALNLEKADMDMKRITDPDKLLIIAREAKALNVRKEALRRVTDAKALFETVISDIPRYCTPEICSRLDELDKRWAWRLNDVAVVKMISIIAENEKDEQFDYRPVATALKRVYAAGRFSGAIEGLEQKAISHVDVQGKAYRDEWCHMDEGYTYFNLTNEM